MEKHVNNFYKKESECKDCDSKRGLNCYYENKDKTSNQRKTILKKNRDRLLIITEKNIRFISFIELLRSYVD